MNKLNTVTHFPPKYSLHTPVGYPLISFFLLRRIFSVLNEFFLINRQLHIKGKLNMKSMFSRVNIILT